MSNGPTWRETMDRLAVNRWLSLREMRAHTHGIDARLLFATKLKRSSAT
jgi:hypothetical protein